MRTNKLYQHLVTTLRLLYRVVPMHEASKFRFASWLSTLPPFGSAMREAQRQVVLELTATQNMTNMREDVGLVKAPSPATSAASESRYRARAGTRAIGYVPYEEEPLPEEIPARVVAFYLPQFHPIPENDEAWGRGFTEWANVTRALPQVEGQVQPRLPGELGFYDLRLREVQERQVELAKQYGISAFCFHFYWFGGKRLLEDPLLDFIGNDKCDLSFCLCWANENWTRRWDGYEDDVLVAQDHSPEDDLAFIEHIAKYLVDPRYLRVDGKPILIVYRPMALPDPAATAARWREYCREHGVGEIHIASTTSFGQSDPAAIGYDATVEFAPNNSNPVTITKEVRWLNPEFSGNVFDWRCLVERSRKYARAPYRVYRGVNPGWDNTPRKLERANIFLHASPRGYEEWLRNAIVDTVRNTPDPSERLVFANAWNEWAEGACLEPDSRLGYAYLAATRRALTREASSEVDGRAAGLPATRKICVVIHAFYTELLDEILARLQQWGIPLRIVVTTVADRRDQVMECLDRRGLDAECRVFENRGRDILPFLEVANELADAGEDLIVKLHTKRSLHRVDGDVWRRDLLDKLISATSAARIQKAFDKRPALGMVGPEGHILPISFYWGSNETNVQYLCRKMGIAPVDPSKGVFAAGSMFWIRMDALRPLLDTHLDESLFEKESGQLDGTMAHAIERCLAPVIRSAGYFLGSSDAPHTAAAALTVEYDYAEASCKEQETSADQ